MNEERAVLAGGCFWGMQDLIRKKPGIKTTRVGYTGGDVLNATYRNHGTHAEAIEITFDTTLASYKAISKKERAERKKKKLELVKAKEAKHSS